VHDSSSPTALLVDDAEDMRLLLAAVAERGGFRPVTARTGREALDLLEGGLRPAVVVTDVEMPVMMGLEFLRRVRGSVAYRDIPVLIHSSTSPPERIEGGAPMPDAWLRKPTDPEALLRAMRHAASQLV